jgi:hypothetical protein
LDVEHFWQLLLYPPDSRYDADEFAGTATGDIDSVVQLETASFTGLTTARLLAWGRRGHLGEGKTR